ncbi:MAG: SDR family NAD(P)-dependent oxidoreductase [Actinomycetia bacterium]|nr:SDR family NAD(P)-dependent oxidoreductase [Actinomycetes bacterium]MCP4226881.1 SDR family NAD(P)-dependent oxidoreductase [Actinomycetes bacterium]MCP5035873.1 SDR family NAD(P)-dependent oxidoreductase [Actinomycetes bacterium]
MEVAGKTAVVTGGASGIGRGMARCFAAAGMAVVVADIEQAPLDEVVAELAAGGTEALGVQTDVSKIDQVEALAASAVDRFGGVHVLCNNAGIGISDPVGSTSIEDWRWTLDIDLWGPIHGVHTFLPLMESQGEGHINSTASMAGLYAGASLGAYNVAKHGVVALMASLERDLRLTKSPVRASVLCPGPINTNIVDSQRNRDPVSAAKHVETETGQKFWDILTRSLAEGMDPDEVGPVVLDAIVNDKFWILTHPQMASMVAKQLNALQNDQSLTR